MNQITMSFEQAVELLKKAVKESHLNNQKHIDLTLVQAHERAKYEQALMITRQEVAQGRISEEELKLKLSLV